MEEKEDYKTKSKDMTLQTLTDSAPKSTDEDRIQEESNEQLMKRTSQDGSHHDDDDDDLEEWREVSESSSVKAYRHVWILIVLTIFTVVNYIVPNIKLVMKYSEAAENNRYVRMTLSYMIAPIFITTLINLAWYIDDDLQAKDNEKPTASRKTWWLRGIFLFLQMGTILRYVQSLVYGYKSKRSAGLVKAKYVKKMVTLERDATLLRSFTSFMQGVPQYALQLYILTEGPANLLEDGGIWQILSMIGCIGTISWATVSCDRMLICTTPKDAIDTKWKIIALLIPWRLFSIASRMTVLALFSTLFPIYLGLGCVAHYLIMYIFIQRQKVATHNGTRGEVFLFLVGGLVFIVTDLLVKYERTYHKYLVYYGIIFVEGAAMMSVWYVYTEIEMVYRNALIIATAASYLAGLFFLRLFYEYTHVQERIYCFCTCCKPKTAMRIDAASLES